MRDRTIDFSAFEKKISVIFNDKDLLREAFTHRSYINENKGAVFSHNERLEFLGDAVLELVITAYLFKKYPNETEGVLTSYRAALVNTNSISAAAHELGMDDFLLLSRGEARDTGKARQYILANTFEAMIGAIYLDQGFDVAQTFIAESLFGKTDEIVRKELWRDAKSTFQEKAQEKVGITPSYQVVDEYGPDHDKEFTVGVFLGDEQVAKATGKSKQEAEQGAALRALVARGWT
ncbi:MAG: ribonuclease III [Candidatus Yonathbacteria bacterium CG_4_10_14_3_um_filter_47_65]|uniref:Ribonuclease 3 n=2 Tax=Parcubacteria group TaxID=1794811 RepID=A0A2M8D6T2_9BACT|nr:MAG: ribonuclease III [Candidatus Nomurabacteria bacterium CG1_02_47_685]PIP03855.1 MAG: ribonuclease III [Candidatus Yonathbacteria bacterium CG23_combo_of_CG06-09_8_20_14_all_46_18]PIQ32205.1 MAG: ribonuclease III [Candidatus Yonathbacteria bacterium CG17_big_fil_post_rev_8_21_14_2_50_46_19]PIX56044.1 MAG: ribonuclease III [Candidatus Yonathbacteria bacterium CG_4_10_14_3_um_filter_47_65]PIY57861.1 MAG: ribonuclease III [Candidatus Yonathbacteria bacterium CG_4_10_14_0_8_um_filter_47_645]